MDILIKGMEMPKEMECIEILLFSNGHCGFRKHERDEWVEAKAVALPEHGRLILDTDVKALLHSGLSLDTDSDMAYVCGLIDGLPTILEANNGTDN